MARKLTRTHGIAHTNPADQDFDFKLFLQTILARQDEAGILTRPSLGVAFEHLTVKGQGSGSAVQQTFGDLLSKPFYAAVQKMKGRKQVNVEKVILNDMSGCVQSGLLLASRDRSYVHFVISERQY